MAKRRMSTFERLESGRLNRKQRRELGRQVATADPGLTIVHVNAGGIDVGNESHYVAVPPDRDPNPVREFGCWTAALNQMAEWLKSCQIDTVAMQATGVYWIALYDVLRGTHRATGLYPHDQPILSARDYIPKLLLPGRNCRHILSAKLLPQRRRGSVYLVDRHGTASRRTQSRAIATGIDHGHTNNGRNVHVHRESD